LWNYIEEAVQISNVTLEPTCPNLVNLTYAPNDGLIAVSDRPCHFKIFNLFTIRTVSIPNEYDNLLNELKISTEENPKKSKRNLVHAVYDDLSEVHRISLPAGEVKHEQLQSISTEKCALLLHQTRLLITRCRAIKNNFRQN